MLNFIWKKTWLLSKYVEKAQKLFKILIENIIQLFGGLIFKNIINKCKLYLKITIFEKYK